MAANASLLKPALYRNTITGSFALAAKSLAGTDLCSIADLSSGEIAAILKLAHAVKDRWPPVKIIVTSGRLSLQNRDLPAGGRFFPKPYNPDDIRGLLREWAI